MKFITSADNLPVHDGLCMYWTLPAYQVAAGLTRLSMPCAHLPGGADCGAGSAGDLVMNAAKTGVRQPIGPSKTPAPGLKLKLPASTPASARAPFVPSSKGGWL